MNISIIIPAHNAAGTLAETIESVRAQTFTDWEAIVVDDGSSDGTAAIATSYAGKDSRIRVISQPKMGVSAARNTGIKQARFDWLLFLDGDDWLSPQHLEYMTNALKADPGLYAVHCGWVHVTPEGSLLEEGFCKQSGDIFELVASTCPFTIHACVVRRSIVTAVGGFDTSLASAEDWDLWQRIARTGAHFGAVPKTLSFYRMRPGSASKNGLRLFVDGRRVIEKGHTSDPRVPNPHPQHVNGRSVVQLQRAVLEHAFWCAGISIGVGYDARPILKALGNTNNAVIDPGAVANCIFYSSLLHACQPQTACDKFFPTIRHLIDEFLLALEEQFKTSRLTHRTNKVLEHLILEHSRKPLPQEVGTLYAVRIEITEPIKDIIPPGQAERLYCKIELEGTFIGMLELPVCDGIISGYVLSDAIAAEYFWKIIGRFFERTVYCDLSVKKGQRGLSVWRGPLCIADNLTEDESTLWTKVHEQYGWTVFLQEIWGRPNWAKEYFYDPKTIDEPAVRKFARDNWINLEVSEDVPDVEISGGELNVLVTVGGVALGVVTLYVKENIATAQELRAAITGTSGAELCRAAVREGLLGRPITNQPSTLRARLAEAAAKTAHDKWEGFIAEMNEEYIPISESAGILNRVLSHGERAIVFGRRRYGEMETSLSRRAILPSAAARELIDAAIIAREPVIQIQESSKNPLRIVYVPELILRNRQTSAVNKTNNSVTTESYGKPNSRRDYFERIFAARPDPWKYTSPYEQKKYEQTLDMLPSGRIRTALELACAEGHFTVKLASLVDDLVAADISQIALDRAARRCANLKNVRFVHLDLTKDPLPGRFELIICSEVLYYVGGQKALKDIAHKLVKALESWGYLLMAHAHVVKDDPDRTGFDWDTPFGARVISETFASISKLRLLKELRTPLYRIQLFQRVPRMYSFLYHFTPKVIELKEQPTRLLPEVAALVKWQHSDRPKYENSFKTEVTERLPILMYHRIAPTGLPETARYRVTPELFEEQLRFLRDTGYYSAGLEDWRAAMEKKRPLPGRAVMITFDDGYADFLTYAWPLLKRYGFSATVFLVADCIGGTNSWDSAYGEEIPLLGWKDILKLRNEGVYFGSHSVSHPFLTSLSPEKIVREGARSRAILEDKLGVTVDAFAYPYGDVDPVVQHLIGACGYIFGLSCRADLCSYHDPLLALPRFEVFGSDSLQDFIIKLGICQTQT
ncbi:MAG: glycosyltransferase [Candidatus Brocadia sp.]|jgi:peptidoglycan/xylan/chitin deacetylase (PgdA/CDA1 family)/GT2 family glycosyltransferase/2-polyprenyl-3-methyl-5-hydroxy-6-metoxy-1,4-benzoquinol methylase